VAFSIEVGLRIRGRRGKPSLSRTRLELRGRGEARQLARRNDAQRARILVERQGGEPRKSAARDAQGDAALLLAGGQAIGSRFAT
jgi:hypothetical protein